jgi:hypothetical protein
VTRKAPIKVLSQLRDLEIVDSEDELCGVCDEVAFEGGPGGPLRIAALLVGRGAWKGRLPRWLGFLARGAVVTVPWDAVAHVTSRITLDRPAADLGLAAADRRLARFIPKAPAP